MPGRSFRIATIAGIPVGISPWWVAIVALITWSLGDGYFPTVIHGIAPALSYALGLASALLLFASILAHEFGHAVVARRRGLVIEEIDLWLLGGVARMRGHPKRPGDELDFALAGPIVTAVIAAAFGVVAALLPHSAPAALRALVAYEAEVNGLILVFNLLPAFPLDGGRVLRALLWQRGGDINAATATASQVGRGFGFILIALGFLTAIGGYLGGLWIALIGVFLVAAAGAARLQQEVSATFTGVRAGDLMSHPVISIPANLSVRTASGDYFAVHRYASFPVIDSDGAAVGLLSIDLLEHLAGRALEGATVGDLADRDPDLLVDPDLDVADLLERPGFARVGRAVVVDPLRRPLGIVSITDVQRVVRARQLVEFDRQHAGLSR